MPGNPLKLKIAYLYPDILQGFCDVANVNAFIYRANQRDIDVRLCEIKRNDRIQAAKYDFYYIGGSNLSGIGNILNCLQNNKEELQIAALSKVPMLACNLGYMLFGRSFQLYNRVETEGAKILNVTSYSVKEHIFNPLCGYCEFLKQKTVVGFRNGNILNVPSPDATPFLKVRGTYEKKSAETEGVRLNNVIGTSMSSAVLAQNPHLCDYFIIMALNTKYKCTIPLAPLCDDIEWYSHKFMLNLK